MEGYRRELKYIVGDDVMTDVRNRIDGLMRLDEHQHSDHYGIRSLYFDDPGLTCYRENLAGVSPREKYRIRTYDCDDKVIMAEIKIRHRDTISKMRTGISREIYDILMSNEPGAESDLMRIIKEMNDEAGRRVLEKFLSKYATGLYRPACIVDYERSAYVYDTGNVRITIDRNVFASKEFDRMFDPLLTGRPALDGNRHILEIKYDEFLPDEIRAVLGGLSLRRCNSSKYAQCIERFL